MDWKESFPKENRYFETNSGILYCGDALEVLPLLPSESIDLLITDPPYGVSKEGARITRNREHYIWKRESDILLDFGEWDRQWQSDEEYFSWTEEWFKEVVRALKPKSWLFVFFDKQKIGIFDLFLAPKYGVKAKTIFVWIKSNPVPSFRKVNFVSSTEFIWVGSKGESKIKNFKSQKEMVNYFIYPNGSAYKETSHPTEKPLALIKHFIEVSSNEGEIVLDPFVGSGTTAIACEMLRRRWIGIEKSEKYCEEIVQRLQKGVQRKLWV